MTSPLGINVTLPTGTASEYQRRRERELERRRRADGSTDQSDNDAQQQAQDHIVISRSEGKESDGNKEEQDEGPRPIGIDLDQEIVPFKPSGAGVSSSDDDASTSDDENDVADAQDDETQLEDEYEDEYDDEISESPPSSMPLLMVDLEGLTGCKPSTVEEKDILMTQVRKALLGQSSAQSGDEDHDTNDDNAEQGLDFTERAAELFDMGAASHCDTKASQQKIQQDDLNNAILEYPEFLTFPGGAGDDTASNVVATSRVWKMLTSSHRIDVVGRILSHLSTTSRDIVWRYQMNAELRLMAKTEEMERMRRERAAELEEWTSGRRKLELERLYQVRETFEYRLNAARRSMDEIVERREERVRAELARRREAGESGGGVDGLDWAEGAATFVFGDEAAGETTSTSSITRPPYEDEEVQSDPYESDESGYELEGEDSGGEGASDDKGKCGAGEEDNTSTEKLPGSRPEATAERRRIRAARSSKRMRKKLARQEKEAKRSAMIEAAKAEERSIREMFTQPEEQLAKALLEQLEERMTKVDDLLEQIQEEEWAEEEGEGKIKREGLHIDVVYDDLDMERHHRPLLDQILAMILGAARPPQGRSKEEHYKFIRDEHQGIVADWWDYFGRLPPALSEQEEGAGLSSADNDASAPADADTENMLAAGTLTALPVDGDDGPAAPSDKPKVPQAHEASASQTPEAMRSMLGIEDNADDDWDDIAKWDEFLPGVGGESGAGDDAVARQASVEPKQQQRKLGLRPGGRIK